MANELARFPVEQVIQSVRQESAPVNRGRFPGTGLADRVWLWAAWCLLQVPLRYFRSPFRHFEGEQSVIRRWLLVPVLALTAAAPARAADISPDTKDVQAVRDKAVAYLRKAQADDGSFSAKSFGPGVTALVVAGLLRNGIGADDPMVAKAIGYLEKKVHKDGGIYDKGLANYTTSVAVMALREANSGGKYDAILKNATKFLKGLQYGEGDKDVKSGGFGYDKSDSKRDRPDASNTAFAVEALLAAGMSKDDPTIKQALKFVSRCQNLPGETNDQPFATKTSDDDAGGLTYTPIDPDDSPHKTPAGGLRSLGAMTYGGLKTFLYAGVTKSDPRVTGAIKWIKAHYTLDENPGMKQAGLYYYYHTFAKAMDALGDAVFVDAKGSKHEWKKDLFEALKKRQKDNGSFVNTGDRTFGEADPNIATAFALMALSYTKGK
jgi:squalene-hopene/tetraprenyl-beta-curcumene cyclase